MRRKRGTHLYDFSGRLGFLGSLFDLLAAPQYTSCYHNNQQQCK